MPCKRVSIDLLFANAMDAGYDAGFTDGCHTLAGSKCDACLGEWKRCIVVGKGSLGTGGHA